LPTTSTRSSHGGKYGRWHRGWKWRG
jgi:hypothetical protein